MNNSNNKDILIDDQNKAYNKHNNKLKRGDSAIN